MRNYLRILIKNIVEIFTCGIVEVKDENGRHVYWFNNKKEKDAIISRLTTQV
jgi:hypothetical protein